MAVAIIFDLIFATALTLAVVPIPFSLASCAGYAGFETTSNHKFCWTNTLNRSMIAPFAAIAIIVAIIGDGPCGKSSSLSKSQKMIHPPDTLNSALKYNNTQFIQPL